MGEALGTHEIIFPIREIREECVRSSRNFHECSPGSLDPVNVNVGCWKVIRPGCNHKGEGTEGTSLGPC